MNRTKWIAFAALFFCFISPLLAQEEQSGGTQPLPAGIRGLIGRTEVNGTGDVTGETQALSVWAHTKKLFDTPVFSIVEGTVSHERVQPYDLTHWGARAGLGWEFSEADQASLTYRYDVEKVYSVSPDADAAFASVEGNTDVTALTLLFQHDTRDDSFYATRGLRLAMMGELASEAFGGDYDFGRLQTTFAGYITPFADGSRGEFLKEVTFVEYFKAGWVTSYGGTDAVPFFERYFAGGSTTVRGSRGRWYTPRGTDDQFTGGEILLLNSVEARRPVFKNFFHQHLSAALFFDVGRAYNRFSEIGDFGYGAGAGLRYMVSLWKVQGLLRVDYGVNLDAEGDNSPTNWHITFGTPF